MKPTSTRESEEEEIAAAERKGKKKEKHCTLPGALSIVLIMVTIFGDTK